MYCSVYYNNKISPVIQAVIVISSYITKLVLLPLKNRAVKSNAFHDNRHYYFISGANMYKTVTL